MSAGSTRGVTDVTDLIAAEASKPVPGDVRAVAETVRSRFGSSVAAILAYGSCLRDVATDESLIDLYVLLRDERAISPNLVSRLACLLLPPNVYYAESTVGGRTLRTKYAVMTLGGFSESMNRSSLTPYFWARFAQPCRVLYSADEACRSTVFEALVNAARTMFARCLDIARPGDDVLSLFERGLKASYAAELRAERADRPHSIMQTNRVYYQELANRILGPGFRIQNAGRGGWGLRIFIGKCLSITRLLKAGFTFDGGADYVAWKVARHSGEPITLTPWQRRHPILMAIPLLPKLLRKGAVR
jgi:hypothetical protein